MEKINSTLVNKIKKYIKNGEHPLIIAISGVNGVGKTTLAFHLSNVLEIKQRVGLGSIVKTLIAMEPKSKDFLRMDNHFTTLIKVSTLHKQSLIISKAVNLMIDKYSRSRVSCIIEGVQLLPIYLDGRITQFHMQVTDSKKYKEQLENCDTRKPRVVSEKELSNLLKLNQVLSGEMNVKGVYILDNSKSLVAIINEMLENIAINLNLK